MTQQKPEKATSREKRSEPRRDLSEYYSVEFSVSRELPVHQFRVRNISPSGIGIMVNEGSAVLGRLQIGDVLDMKYNRTNPSGAAEHLRTEIRHISKLEQGRFRGHYLVGMKILDQTDAPS